MKENINGNNCLRWRVRHGATATGKMVGRISTWTKKKMKTPTSRDTKMLPVWTIASLWIQGTRMQETSIFHGPNLQTWQQIGREMLQLYKPLDLLPDTWPPYNSSKKWLLAELRS